MIFSKFYVINVNLWWALAETLQKKCDTAFLSQLQTLQIDFKNKPATYCNFFNFKGTVSDILSDALSKDGMPDSQRYPKNLYLTKNLKNNIVF